MAEDKIINDKALYTPKCAAMEYGRIGCNFYTGCPHECEYCYLKRGITGKALGGTEVRLKKCFKDEADAAHILRNELDKHLEQCQRYGIFLSFTTDPMIDETRELTSIAISEATVRDTIITTYKVDVNIGVDLDKLYTELQSEYRKLQAEKNGIEAKFSNMAMAYQTRKMEEWKAAKSQYDRDLTRVNSELVGIQTRMQEWKKQRLEELAALKIIIPNDLKPLYKSLQVKYL